MRWTRRHSRSLAAFWLTALCISTLHFHVETHEGEFAQASPSAEAAAEPASGGAPDRARLSSDDAHHEHSSHGAPLHATCLACRSQCDDDIDGAVRRDSTPTHPSSPQHAATNDPEASSREAALPRTRAPPARVA